MAKVKLVQEGNDISIMVKNLINTSGTKLSNVCEEHGLNYGDTHKKINATNIDAEWLKELVGKINPNAVIGIDFSIRIEIDGNEVFNQKIQ